jgi:NADH-quinone oxidoreductase subunit C
MSDAENGRAPEKGGKPQSGKAEAQGRDEPDKQPWEVDPQAPEWVDASTDPLAESLQAVHPDAIRSAATFAGDLALEVAREAVREVGRSLNDEHGYTMLVDICGAHFPQREEEPFEVVYILYSLEQNRRVRLKLQVGDGEEVPSLTSVYAGANWPEREVYDLYGVRFSEHPDLTRILLWEGFNGHPLRKEFPLEGIDTGAAIYPEYYGDTAGPVAGTGTGWRPPQPSGEPEGEDGSGEP